jgi:D-glycero-D-manno-heptose 1,7-bisphosphate phosphatase
MGIRPVRPDRGAAAVFLDRDGVLNRAILEKGHAHPPATLDEVEILPGVPEALQALKARGYWLIVVTNQPDVARGRQSRAVVEDINALLQESLPLDQILVCYHDDADGCECRKPRPGLLLRAAEQHGIDLARSYMVGDRWRDIEAGQRAGCKTILIDYGYSEPATAQPDHVAKSLSLAVEWILQQSRLTGDLS